MCSELNRVLQGANASQEVCKGMQIHEVPKSLAKSLVDDLKQLNSSPLSPGAKITTYDSTTIHSKPSELSEERHFGTLKRSKGESLIWTVAHAFQTLFPKETWRK